MQTNLPHREAMPITCIRWRPSIPGETSKTANVLITTSSDGVIAHWHLNSGKCLHHMKEENENNLYALDI